MIASDIVTQLRLLLPQLTDKFTDDVAVSSITRSGTMMTVVCNEKHGLEARQAFSIHGTDVPISITTLIRAGTIGTLAVGTNHDLTLPIAPTIRITGAAESEYNGTFETIDITNRRAINFVMADSGPLFSFGSPVLRDAESALRSYNSTYQVDNVINPSTFTFTHSVSGLANPDGDEMLIRTKPRISSGITIERLIASYTKENTNQYWAFVVLGNVDASQSRQIESDATDNIQRGAAYRQQLIQPFTVFVFMPVSAEIAASESRDEASNLFRPLLRSLLFSKFDSGLYAGAFNPVQFVSHSVHSYNTSVYIHAYEFQQVADIYEEDTVGPDLDVAFRNIDFNQPLDFGTQVNFMQGTLDLDDDSL